MAKSYKRGSRYAWVVFSDGQRREFALPLTLTQTETEAAIRADVAARNPGQEIAKIDYNPAFAVEVKNA